MAEELKPCRPTDAQVEAAARAMMRFCGIDPNAFVALHGGYGYWLDDARAALEAATETKQPPDPGQ